MKLRYSWVNNGNEFIVSYLPGHSPMTVPSSAVYQLLHLSMYTVYEVQVSKNMERESVFKKTLYLRKIMLDRFKSEYAMR